ncbi:PD40 domain-containing protein [soil metagenome]
MLYFAFVTHSLRKFWLPARFLPLSLLAFVMFVSGCTAQNFLIKAPTPGASIASTPSATAQSAQTKTELAQTGVNRLLVLGEDGNLFTVNSDGKERIDLTTNAGSTHIYVQPTWSPTGDSIGWGQLDRTSDTLASSVVTSRPDGSIQTQTDVPFPPFFLNWRPDGKQLAYLGNWVAAGEQTIALRLIDVATGGTISSTLGVGQPFYFSWSPDGKQMLTHIDNERTALLTMDGKETVLAAASTNFATPQWALDGDKLLYVLAKEGQSQLVIADAAGAVQQEVTFVEGETVLNFSLSPKSDLLAYTETDQAVGLNSLGPLFLFNLANKKFQELSADPVVAFFWSPDGHALLFLTPEIQGQELWINLHVWDGKAARTLSRFMPSSVFLQQYLPFADQYAQSTQLWSPDSSAVVFAGQDENAQTGVWVQPIDGKGSAQHVSDGVFATWSPH